MAEEEHELYDGIDEEGNIVPTALIAACLVVIVTGLLFTFPLWGGRAPGSYFYVPGSSEGTTVWFGAADVRPWWDIGYTMVLLDILMVAGWFITLIKKGIR